jgi:hypothetical protein
VRTSCASILNAKDMVLHCYSSYHLSRPRRSRGPRVDQWLVWDAAVDMAEAKGHRKTNI